METKKHHIPALTLLLSLRAAFEVEYMAFSDHGTVCSDLMSFRVDSCFYRANKSPSAACLTIHRLVGS